MLTPSGESFEGSPKGGCSRSGPALASELRRAGGAVWPDGTHSQIYTNPDGPDAYVELELLGPLHDLAPGQSASLTSRYELHRRDRPGRVVPVTKAPRN